MNITARAAAHYIGLKEDERSEETDSQKDQTLAGAYRTTHLKSSSSVYVICYVKYARALTSPELTDNDKKTKQLVYDDVIDDSAQDSTRRFPKSDGPSDTNYFIVAMALSLFLC
ncbi:hypothetical protein OUZ56_008261 [Daphnia magna]|uniref:Uncharacterized protein n=1 Tax=Daphnia magna TaxID=35525 RepID=A0ABR0ACJ2_9CRUS|nr:hypothetical protein OUZ56_008261 [Daphnia magna]